MTTQLRALRSGDVAEVARLHERAFPAFFLSSLGQPFLRQFYRGFLGDSSAVTVVALNAGGRIVGAAVGTIEPNRYFSRLLRRQLAGFVVASTQAIIRQPSVMARLVKAIGYRGAGEKPLAGALLSSICVAPDAQHDGVGRHLLAAWEKCAADLGARMAYLTTDADHNDPVNTFYQRGGWALHSVYITPEGRAMNLYTSELSRSKPGSH